MRILITGASGFIGSFLTRKLLEKGHTVVGLSHSCEEKNLLQADLLNPQSLIDKLDEHNFDYAIHCAAIAHGQSAPKGETIFSANVKMTANILKVLNDKCENIIFISSVAVYGEDGRTQPVGATDLTRPYNDYGKSKLASEECLLSASYKNTYTLRLAPVFSPENLINVKKRIELPGLNIKFRTAEDRAYSLCSLETVLSSVNSIINNPPTGNWLYLLSDVTTYSQNEILSWFNNTHTATIPKSLIATLYFILRCIPFGIGYKFRCLFWKLLKSNVYKNEFLNIDDRELHSNP